MSLRETLQGEVIDHHLRLTLTEFAARAHVENGLVVEFVESGVLEPQGNPPDGWEFSGDDLHRLRCAVRLMHDLNVNIDGAAIILDLLAERQRLRAHLEMLESLFD